MTASRPRDSASRPRALALHSRTLALLLAAGWAVLVWTMLTSTRVSVGPWYPWMPWVWNLGHAPLFGVQAALIGLALRPGRVPGPGATDADEPRAAHAGRRAFFLGAALALVYGVLIEWRQAQVPGRHASGLDVITDAVGALGVPWALATGALFSRRALVVFLVASVAALIATYA
jgi:hypothetical protein